MPRRLLALSGQEVGAVFGSRAGLSRYVRTSRNIKTHALASAAADDASADREGIRGLIAWSRLIVAFNAASIL